MKFLVKLERKFGKYAINNLNMYILIIYGIGTAIDIIHPSLYGNYLMLDVEKVLQGEVWRLVTFVLQPTLNRNIFLFFQLHLYYMIGSSLENVWGSFRFNLYYFSGVFFNILAIFIVYFITGESYILGLSYINRSMFFAYALIFPNVQFLLMFLIQVKIKYLAAFYAFFFVADIIRSLFNREYHIAVAILVSFANFLIYFFATRKEQISPGEIMRRRKFKKAIKQPSGAGKVVEFRGKRAVSIHECAVCGRTEYDGEDLEFRFCSKCDGNYEYCMEHLFTHEHKS